LSEAEYDVVVIGGGISGLTAAVDLAESGRRVAVVSRGDPIACLSTGCIDLLDGTANPLAALASLPDRHPYRLLGEEGVEQALEKFRERMAAAGLVYMGSPRVNRAILTPLGTFKTTCLVPETMNASPGRYDEAVHIVSFAGLKDFYPSYIQARFRRSTVSVFEAGPVTPLSLAQSFETPPFRGRFLDWLGGLDRTEEKIGLPAVLGLNGFRAIQEAVEEKAGLPVFEIPTLPPSVAGMRLFRALKGCLKKAGGQLYWGRPVASVERYGRVVEAVTIAARGRRIRVNGKAFVLATGSFVSGGLYARIDGIQETVLGLPVQAPSFRGDWFSPDFFPPCHPIEEAGVEVDESWRPAGTSLENVFVCGSLLAHGAVLKNGCGHGMAIATGNAAARSCRAYLETCEGGGPSCSRIA
jgi:glycerol-3-phosphate dehydrogenase subunit B